QRQGNSSRDAIAERGQAGVPHHAAQRVIVSRVSERLTISKVEPKAPMAGVVVAAEAHRQDPAAERYDGNRGPTSATSPSLSMPRLAGSGGRQGSSQRVAEVRRVGAGGDGSQPPRERQARASGRAGTPTQSNAVPSASRSVSIAQDAPQEP